jgi:hypothetical protein
MRPLSTIFLITCIVIGAVVFSGCMKDDSVGLYDPNAQQAPTPTITSISPAGSAFAGIDTVIVQGANFSSSMAANYVYFNAQSATLLSATATQLTLKAPVVTMDSIGVRVAVQGAVSFSNTFRYRLTAAVSQFGRVDTSERFVALTTDAAGNLCSGYYIGTKDAGVLKYSPAGVRSIYAPATAGVDSWRGLKFGPSGYLYAARNFRAIYRVSPGGGASAVAWAVFGSGIYIYDFDFDADGNIWGGGNNANIYKVDNAKVITPYPFVANIHSVRVYGGYMYFAAKTDAGEKIWRAPITAGVLGTPEVYYDFGAAFPTAVALAITFGSDGSLYIGTNASVGLVIVSPGKTISTPFALYSSSFGTGLGFLAWGSADDLYASTSDGILLKFTVRGKSGAALNGNAL